MFVGGHAAIFAAIFRLAIDDLHRNDAVGVAHGIIIFGQFLPVLVPFHSGRWIAAQAAEQFAGLPDLDDTRSQQEGKARRRLDHLQPHIVTERFPSAYWLQLWPVLRNLSGQC